MRDVQAALYFYETVLGFQPAIKVPEAPPYVFASATSGGVEIFFNDMKAVTEDYPPLAREPLGGTLTLFLKCEGIEDVLQRVQRAGAKIVMPLKTQFYGIARIRLPGSRQLDHHDG